VRLKVCDLVAAGVTVRETDAECDRENVRLRVGAGVTVELTLAEAERLNEADRVGTGVIVAVELKDADAVGGRVIVNERL
jgi:hypothetical protein